MNDHAQLATTRATVPVRLDRLLLRWLPGVGNLDPETDPAVGKFLMGCWFAVTAVLALLALVLLTLPMPAPAFGIAYALVLSVPGSMVVLRGIFDGVSLGKRAPRYTRNTAVWVLAYGVAFAGALAALLG